jgi:hypothetical protein
MVECVITYSTFVDQILTAKLYNIEGDRRLVTDAGICLIWMSFRQRYLSSCKQSNIQVEVYAEWIVASAKENDIQRVSCQNSK